jgi:hypothetical protein
LAPAAGGQGESEHGRVGRCRLPDAAGRTPASAPRRDHHQVDDRYAGETFRAAFRDRGIAYETATRSASELYEALEPRLNAHGIVVLDMPTLEQQLLGLVWRGGKITHQPGEHDDFANALAGVVEQVLGRRVADPS